MENPSNRHDLTDSQWEKWESIIQKQLGKWGGSHANDTRTLINGVGWILKNRVPWRDLPNEYGPFSSVHKRYKRWCDKGHWEAIFKAFADGADFSCLMIDATHCLSGSSTRRRGGNPTMGGAQKGAQYQGPHGCRCQWHACECVIITSGATADCTQATDLIEGIEAEALIADRAYDTNEIIDFSQTKGMKRVIPSKKNSVNPHRHDELLYRCRHLIENTFLKLKRWRSIATRYAKTTSAFSGAVWLASIFLWLKPLS